MGKSWDTKKVNDFIENFVHAAHNYMEGLGYVNVGYEKYMNNETFVGGGAEQTKLFIGTKQSELNRLQYDLSNEIIKRYIDLDDIFKAIVDPAADAKIDTDVIKSTKEHFRRQFEEYESLAYAIQQRTMENVDRFKKYYGDIEEVYVRDALAYYDDFCCAGGFLDSCIKKVEEFDDEASRRLSNSGIKDSIIEHTNEISEKAAGLDSINLQAVEIDTHKFSLVALGAIAALASNKTISKNSAVASSEIKTLMKQYGYTKEEAELINKAINSLDDASLLMTKNPYKRIEHIYGTLSALCISYNSTRWQLTTGQKATRGAILDLKFAGMSEQEILDLQVLINLQHGNFSKEKLYSNGIDVSKSSFADETHANIINRMNGDTNDFAHSVVQLAAFAHGDNMYKNNNLDPRRWVIDLFNSPTDSQFDSTMTRYEISFKGDIDSGRYSEEDFKSDIDAINIYNRMLKKSDVNLGAWKSYYDDVDNNSKARAIEFFKNMGEGDVDIGIINTSKVVEAETYGSIYIKEGNETDIDKAKSTFMQWIMSVYQGVEYDFPEEN